MFALVVEEQAHMYERIIGVFDTLEEAKAVEKKLCVDLVLNGFEAEGLYTHVEEMPLPNGSVEDTYKIARDFIIEFRNL